MGLLQKEMLGDIVINVINILILFFVARALLYKPVKKFLTARREKEAKALEEANRLEAQAREKREEYEALLSDAEGEKERTVKDARNEAQRQAEKIVSEAEKEAADLLSRSAAAAEAEKEKLLQGARDEISGLALELSGKIMGREVTDEDNVNIINRFFSQLGE